MTTNPVACFFPANGKIKQWRFLAQTIQNSTIKVLPDLVKIICSLSRLSYNEYSRALFLSLVNKYRCPAIKDISIDKQMAAEMLKLLHSENELQRYLQNLEENKLIKWKKYDAQHCPFPYLTEEDVRNITFGE